MHMGFVNDWVRRSKGSPFNPGGAVEELFLHYCNRVREGKIEPWSTDSYDIVDNFYVNGDFLYERDHTKQEWSKIKRECIDWCDTDEGQIAVMQF